MKIPPPTRKNNAMSEPPKPKPTSIAEEVFWNSAMMIVAPNKPRPTVNIPATPPVRKATSSASRIDPRRAAAAVRMFPRVASVIPMYPVRPDATQPSKKAMVRKMPDDTKLSAVSPFGFSIATEVTNTMMATGTRIMPMVRNCRLRYAHAPT